MDMKSTLVLLVLSATCGALAGAAAGFVTSSPLVETSTPLIVRHTTTTIPIVPPVKSKPDFSLVPIEQRAVSSLLPPDFVKHGFSSSGAVYRKPIGQALEDKFLGNDRLLGQAVALTADGWYVTAAQNVSALHVADMVLWHAGKSFAVQKVVLDSLNQTAFLKTAETNLSSAAFARAQDVVPGAGLWVETRAQEFSPRAVLSVGLRVLPTDITSSESAVRRIGLDGMTVAGDRGAAVWDANGSLVGIVDSAAAERLHVIPVTSIASSFESLVTVGEIRHALLGVRALDLSSLRFDGDRGLWPAAGALIRDDRKGVKLGVLREGPAAKAKLKAGDVIVRVEHDILDGTTDLGEILSEYKPGAQVSLRVLRGTQDLDVLVTLGSVVTSELLK